MTNFGKNLAVFGLGAAMAFGSVASAMAQEVPADSGQDVNVPAASVKVVEYETWQPQWDRGIFDAKHVILGRVTAFKPYRLSIHQRNGVDRTIYLKKSTIIRPEGSTPQPGDRVAVSGYFSKGGFVANRVILPPVR